MINTNGIAIDAYTTYSVQYIRTSGPRKGQTEFGMERTDGNAKFSALRDYKVVAVRERIGN